MPDPGETIRNGTLCIHDETGCCQNTMEKGTIEVKHCIAGFYVYKLKYTNSQQQAYCIGA